jgi:hypothetical protein
MFKNLKQFWSLNLKDYEAIDVDFPIGVFFTLLIFAFVISVFVIYFRRRAIFDISTALLRHECFDEKRAKTLKALRLYTFIFKYEIKKNRRLSSMLSIKGRKALSYEEYLALDKAKQKEYEKIDFETAEFFLSENGKRTAETVTEKSNVSILSPIILSLLAITLLFILAEHLPSLLKLIK